MEAILGIAIFFVAIIQIMMIVKFFEIASDMKDVRNMLTKAIQQKKEGTPEVKQEPQVIKATDNKEVSPKLTWQSWVALIIILAGAILYLSSR